ncbi:MAG: hypothetical protein AAF570_21495, partial [Bacteroidota bacterium]
METEASGKVIESMVLQVREMVYICPIAQPEQMNNTSISSLCACVLLAFALLLSACDGPANSAKKGADVQIKDLQGTWTLSHRTIERIRGFIPGGFAISEIGAAARHWMPSHLRFRGDSLEIFDYPLEFDQTYSLEVKKGHLVASYVGRRGDPWHIDLGEIFWDRDSLLLTSMIEDSWLTNHYFRDTLNADTLTLLRRDSVNASKLLGKWRLDTFIDVEYDESYPLRLPFTVPDSLVFTAERIAKIKSPIVHMSVNGKLRPFRVGFRNKNRISFRALDWWTKGHDQIRYDRDYFISLLGDEGPKKLADVKRLEIQYGEDLGKLLGDDPSARTVKTTEDPAIIAQFLDQVLQLPYEGNGPVWKDR